MKDCQKLSQTSCIPPKALLEALIAYWQRPEKTLRNFETFSAESPKKSGKNFFIEAFFPQKNLVDTRKAIFKTVQFFFPKVRKFHDQAKKPQTFILLRNLSSLEKTPLEAWLTILAALSKNCSPKTEKHYTQSPKTYKKKYF